MLCMVTFTINIPPMLAYIPYMDPMCSPIFRDGTELALGVLKQTQPRHRQHTNSACFMQRQPG